MKVAEMSLKLSPHAIRTFAYPLVVDMLKTNPYAHAAQGDSLPPSVRPDGPKGQPSPLAK